MSVAVKHVVFWTSQYQKLGLAIAEMTGADVGLLEERKFPDGETYHRVGTDVRGRDVIIIGGTVDDAATLDLFDVCCAISAYGARSLKIFIPYYGYSTMERALLPGEVVKAKTRARIFSSIPIATHGNQIMLLELHAEGVALYFEGPVKTRHLFARPLILREARLAGGENFILGSTDAGRAKAIETLAMDLGVPAGFIYKRRAHDGRVSIAGVNVSVGGQKVVIYDDMIRSGGSLIQAAQAYKDAGATEITAITTHGVFTPGAVEKIKASGLFTQIVATDSHPNALRINDPFLKVVSVAEIFASAVDHR